MAVVNWKTRLHIMYNNNNDNNIIINYDNDDNTSYLLTYFCTEIIIEMTGYRHRVVYIIFLYLYSHFFPPFYAIFFLFLKPSEKNIHHKKNIRCIT